MNEVSPEHVERIDAKVAELKKSLEDQGISVPDIVVPESEEQNDDQSAAPSLREYTDYAYAQ